MPRSSEVSDWIVSVIVSETSEPTMMSEPVVFDSVAVPVAEAVASVRPRSASEKSAEPSRLPVRLSMVASAFSPVVRLVKVSAPVSSSRLA
ncbi:hypothetical protein [Breoghania sp.]|uniref:hypothetical protein n=1 Tax=Breoghania sp. TaxID=2065378 RepID=UPI0026162FF2|nr:hypothetical protein [Breoghania sp.]MDJ0932512.1 hypothetical protein [Breoghania sp.]